MIRILYDARFITSRRTGVGRVAEMLLRTLLESGSDLDVHVIHRQSLEKTLRGNHPLSVKMAFDNHPWGDLHRNIVIRRLVRQRQIDVFFSPAFYCIQMARHLPQVVLVHDLGVFDVPESIGPCFRFYLRQMIRSTVRNATRITTPSEFVRGRLCQLFSSIDNRIDSIHLGVDPLFSRYDDCRAEELRSYYCLPERFILCTATIESRKNLMTLLDAYAIYSGRSAHPLHLVLIGDDGYGANEIHRRAEAADLSTRVRFLGYVPDTELALILGLAECMIYPSLYEGFGLPVIEAMAAGCPVITSNCASLPEVAGDSAMLIDPRNPLEIERSLRTMTGNASVRRSYSIAGKERARLMTWKKTAAAYQEVFRQVAEQGNRQET